MGDNEVGPWAFTKPQDLRIIDVFALGPFMIWFGYNAKGMPEWARTAMIVSGMATIAYNGANWLARREFDAGADVPPAI